MASFMKFRELRECLASTPIENDDAVVLVEWIEREENFKERLASGKSAEEYYKTNE